MWVRGRRGRGGGGAGWSRGRGGGGVARTGFGGGRGAGATRSPPYVGGGGRCRWGGGGRPRTMGSSCSTGGGWSSCRNGLGRWFQWRMNCRGGEWSIR